MRVWIAGALMAWAPVVVAAETGIEKTIETQIEAFQNEDAMAAFSFASPSIQKFFGAPDTFAEMVRQGYPMVWRPDEVRFLDRREIAGNLWQRVLIRDGQGVLHVLDYQMVRIDGAWRINSVQILGAPRAGA
ncbi:DUF4864 domain-containing protein [uncultured Shimia sp.]|uniref:DUF4864 domain-containing protein n=1 Tax=uncultured Shimia sp. TaxID=573152 RepID=UPI00261108A7|nr:DUF4864 domain-containing protein [uncultured Shimia sp.]